MADPRPTPPALLVLAGFSRHADALLRARVLLEAEFGPVALTSPAFPFHHTAYYEPEMGPDLMKQFFCFEGLFHTESLASAKLRTNALERVVAEQGGYAETRPLNLDPGYLVLGKFVLATTKDQAHRVYLRDGIFAEVTLHFRDGAFEPWPWTYADYREPGVLAFLAEARRYYRRRLREAGAE